jgi:putative DNA primase/helicase
MNSSQTPNRKHDFDRQATKPTALPVMPAGIPVSMKTRDQWVLWRYEQVDRNGSGKWTKPPYQVRHQSVGASSTDSSTWAPFAEAMAAFLRGGWDGIGYVLAGDEVGIDLDNVRDPETGAIEPWANEVVNMLNAFAEFSPSATGLKIIAKGTLEKDRKRKFTHLGAEIYSTGRYFTVTGHVINEVSAVEDRQAEIDAAYAMLNERNEAAKIAKAGGKGVSQRKAKIPCSPSATLTDDELIAKASASRGETGKKFCAFMQGGINGYSSQSEADLAFCNLIVFWTDDPDQVRRIVQASGMNRDKWERDDYAKQTINKALEGRRNRYNPLYRSNEHKHYEHNRQAHNERAGVGEIDGHAETDSYCLTDLGNGRRFAADHSSIARYCHPWGKWLLWDGKRWRIDDTGQATELAKQTILQLFTSAEQQVRLLREDETLEGKARLARIKAMLDWAMKSQGHSRIRAMLDLAKSEPGIPILPGVLDADPWMLNCTNGTLDLRTGTLRAHAQDDYLTKLCPVAFDPAAACQRWENFLAEIFDYSEALIGYMQRLSGYWLTGQTTEHALPVLWGSGANGKSTLVGAIFDLLGPDYSGKASRDLLTAIKGDKHPTSLAWLHGKRFIGAIETAEGARLDEVLVKELTGGDAITARRMREDFWQFNPSHKIALVTNHKPTIKGTDHAIWRRLRLIPFNVCFPEEKQDKSLAEKIRAELPGVLAWMVQGCLIWQKHGLADPPEVVAATAEYRNAEDRLGAFLAERCQLNTEFRVKASELYGAYRKWCESTGEQSGTATAFTRALVEREIELDAGRRWYLGIAIATEGSE